jgi:3-hydroxy-3-methylglutaryl CoA synthase
LLEGFGLAVGGEAVGDLRRQEESAAEKSGLSSSGQSYLVLHVPNTKRSKSACDHGHDQ